MSSLRQVISHIIIDWKTKQNKTSFECGVQLENELAHFTLDEIDAMVSEIDKCRRLLRDVVFAHNDECQLPYDCPKASTMRAIRVYLKETQK